ncbi:MAG: phage tail protein [Bryobacteraceae bacterium]
MATPFLGEIKIISWNFPPKGWAFCNGQLLPINQNQALFSILGTTYGGNGQTTFALPNLQGRVPLHVGGGLLLGQNGGQRSHTLTMSEMPAHPHVAQATSTGPASLTAAGNVLSQPATNRLYAAPSSLVTLSPQAVTSAGGSQPHLNVMPELVLNFIIALVGIFPSRN